MIDYKTSPEDDITTTELNIDTEPSGTTAYIIRATNNGPENSEFETENVYFNDKDTQELKELFKEVVDRNRKTDNYTDEANVFIEFNGKIIYSYDTGSNILKNNENNKTYIVSEKLMAQIERLTMKYYFGLSVD